MAKRTKTETPRDPKRLLLAEYEKRREQRPWAFYSPVPAIQPFHASVAPIRVLLGPNRGGKTYCGAYEAVCYATGHNPIRGEDYKVPNNNWAVCLNHKSHEQEMLNALWAMVPKGTRFNRHKSTFTLPAPWKSTIAVKSQEEGPEAFVAAGLQSVWIDEPAGGNRGEKIFGEIYARRKPGVPLRIFCTYTPLQGFDWSWRRLVDPKSQERYPGVEVFGFTLHDCSIAHGGFLSDEEISTIESGYTEFEREVRVYGRYGNVQGNPYYSPRLIKEAGAKCDVGKTYKIRMGVTGAVLEQAEQGELTIFRPPVSGKRYIIGADIGGGVHRDATVASVWDRDELAIVAKWKSNKVEPDIFASQGLLPLAIYHGSPPVVIESNAEYGGIVISEIKGRYHNLYRHRQWDRIKGAYSDQYGWKTTRNNRMQIFQALARCLREGTWTPDAGLLDEMSTIVATEEVNGEWSADHMEGRNDDEVVAAGIALAVHFNTPMYKFQRPETARIPESDMSWMYH